MMKCARCGKDTPGRELSPGAVSAICDECFAPPKAKPASVKRSSAEEKVKGAK